jgi:hypothetical protein
MDITGLSSAIVRDRFLPLNDFKLCHHLSLYAAMFVQCPAFSALYVYGIRGQTEIIPNVECHSSHDIPHSG